MQEGFDQRQDTFVTDPSTYPAHQGRVVDRVETRFDVGLEHPLVASGAEVVDLRGRVLGSASGAEPVGTRVEVRLKDRFEHQLQGGLDGARVFTIDLLTFQSVRCPPAAALRHVHGFPVLGLLRRLRPTAMPSADGVPSRRDRAWLGGLGRDHCGGSHVHHGSLRWDRRPAMPLRSSTSTPQTFPVATRPGDYHPTRSRAVDFTPPGAPRPSPDLSGSSWWAGLRGFRTPVPRVRLSISLAGPGPSDNAGPSRRCRGCSHPTPAPPGSGCPQASPDRCDGPATKDSHLRSNPQRLVAHKVHQPHPVAWAGRGTPGDEEQPTTCDQPDNPPAATARAGATPAPPSRSTPGARRHASTPRSCDDPTPATPRHTSPPTPRPRQPPVSATAP